MAHTRKSSWTIQFFFLIFRSHYPIYGFAVQQHSCQVVSDGIWCCFFFVHFFFSVNFVCCFFIIIIEKVINVHENICAGQSFELAVETANWNCRQMKIEQHKPTFDSIHVKLIDWLAEWKDRNEKKKKMHLILNETKMPSFWNCLTHKKSVGKKIPLSSWMKNLYWMEIVYEHGNNDIKLEFIV